MGSNDWSFSFRDQEDSTDEEGIGSSVSNSKNKNNNNKNNYNRVNNASSSTSQFTNSTYSTYKRKNTDDEDETTTMNNSGSAQRIINSNLKSTPATSEETDELLESHRKLYARPIIPTSIKVNSFKSNSNSFFNTSNSYSSRSPVILNSRSISPPEPMIQAKSTLVTNSKNSNSTLSPRDLRNSLQQFRYDPTKSSPTKSSPLKRPIPIRISPQRFRSPSSSPEIRIVERERERRAVELPKFAISSSRVPFVASSKKVCTTSKSTFSPSIPSSSTSFQPTRFQPLKPRLQNFNSLHEYKTIPPPASTIENKIVSVHSLLYDNPSTSCSSTFKSSSSSSNERRNLSSASSNASTSAYPIIPTTLTPDLPNPPWLESSLYGPAYSLPTQPKQKEVVTRNHNQDKRGRRSTSPLESKGKKDLDGPNFGEVDDEESYGNSRNEIDNRMKSKGDLSKRRW